MKFSLLVISQLQKTPGQPGTMEGTEGCYDMRCLITVKKRKRIPKKGMKSRT